MNKGKFNLRKNLHSKDLILLRRQQMSKQFKQQSARLWPMISFQSEYDVLGDIFQSVSL